MISINQKLMCHIQFELRLVCLNIPMASSKVLWMRYCRIIINDTHGKTHTCTLLKLNLPNNQPTKLLPGAEICAKRKSTFPCLSAVPAIDSIAGLYNTSDLLRGYAYANGMKSG
jgi:hypothetical protein